MIFEGLFSLVYHLCPSKLSFQFDTAFMFVIARLIVMHFVVQWYKYYKSCRGSNFFSLFFSFTFHFQLLWGSTFRNRITYAIANPFFHRIGSLVPHYLYLGPIEVIF